MRKQETARRRRSLSLILTLTLVAQLCMQVVASAQTDRGRIAGTVRDQTKAVIEGAPVTVKNERTGEERTVNTDEQGSFMVSNLHRPCTQSVSVHQVSANRTSPDCNCLSEKQ